ncbi:hypothetical protein GQX74_011516 [Glossina fuscipes]|nr:hypothetical protein GQX74_011516 [Glossina fuscipes]
MRIDNHTHIRHFVLYHFGKVSKAAQSFRNLNELSGEGTISEYPCREWFALLKFWGKGLEDKPGRGQPTDFDDQAVSTAVEGNESLTTRILADNSNVDRSTIVCRLKKLGKCSRTSDNIIICAPTYYFPINIMNTYRHEINMFISAQAKVEHLAIVISQNTNTYGNTKVYFVDKNVEVWTTGVLSLTILGNFHLMRGAYQVCYQGYKQTDSFNDGVKDKQIEEEEIWMEKL